MPTKKQQQQELRDIKARAREAKAERKVAAAKASQKAAKSAARAAPLSVARPAAVMVTAAEVQQSKAAAAAAQGLPAPAHRLEVHVKKEQVTVWTTLHGIPHQKIDISESSPATFVVDTSGHTKKLRLELPLPHGMQVDVKAGDHTLTSGVLCSVFPVTVMPKEVAAQWNNRLDSVRKAQRSRFTVTAEGNLKVRHRQTLLNSSAAAKAAALEAVAAKAAKAQMRAEDATADDVDAAAAAKAPKGKGKGKGAAAAREAERKAMLATAAESGAKAQLSLKEKISAAQVAHRRRAQHVEAADARKAGKSAQMAAAFQRVLAQKRESVASKAERLDAPVAQKGKGPRGNSAAAGKGAKKGAGSKPAGKKVKFA